MVALNLEDMQEALQTKRFGRSYGYRTQTGSTNDDARAAYLAGAAPGHLVVADTQTAGRGSRGRSWQSPAGTDLYLSIVDCLPVPLAALPPLTLAVGLAVAETVDALLQRTGQSQARVKWPNDVLVDSRKCAGILIETSTGMPRGDCVVIGIGLNVNRTLFPEDLTATATSLLLSARSPIDRQHALRLLLERVEARVDEFVQSGPTATIRGLSSRLAMLGRRVRCDATEGILRGVAPSGALLLETARGLEQVIAGRLAEAEVDG